MPGSPPLILACTTYCAGSWWENPPGACCYIIDRWPINIDTFVT
jgi:hypothetical protein